MIRDEKGYVVPKEPGYERDGDSLKSGIYVQQGGYIKLLGDFDGYAGGSPCWLVTAAWTHRYDQTGEGPGDSKGVVTSSNSAAFPYNGKVGTTWYVFRNIE